MVNERELLEAGAINCKLNVGTDDGMFDDLKWWNPLSHPGHCSDMESQLMISIKWMSDRIVASRMTEDGVEIVVEELYINHKGNWFAARRLASLKCAGRTK